ARRTGDAPSTPTKGATRNRLVTVEIVSSSATTSTAARGSPISSSASRRAASSSEASIAGCTFPPGKATSPRCEGMVSGRRVSTTRVSPPASNSGTRTAAAWLPGMRGAGGGAGKARQRRRTSSSGSRRASDASLAQGAGPPRRMVGGRGIFWAPPRRATTSVGRLELRRQLLEQLLHATRLEVGHDLPGRRLALLPLHPGGEQLGRVDRNLLHGGQPSARHPPVPKTPRRPRNATGVRLPPESGKRTPVRVGEERLKA